MHRLTGWDGFFFLDLRNIHYLVHRRKKQMRLPIAVNIKKSVLSFLPHISHAMLFHLEKKLSEQNPYSMSNIRAVSPPPPPTHSPPPGPRPRASHRIHHCRVPAVAFVSVFINTNINFIHLSITEFIKPSPNLKGRGRQCLIITKYLSAYKVWFLFGKMDLSCVWDGSALPSTPLQLERRWILKLSRPIALTWTVRCVTVYSQKHLIVCQVSNAGEKSVECESG